MHQNVAHAALLARWSWQKLPVEIIAQAEDLRRRADAAGRHQVIRDQVALQLGSLGISPGFGGGFLGFNPDQAMFISVMAMIRQHNGDPPAGSTDVIAVAEPVLTGQRQPHDALIAAAPPEARQLYAILLPVVRQFGFEKLFLVASYVQATFALPRERIIHLLPDANRLRLQSLYELVQNGPLNETDRPKMYAVFLWFVGELIESGAISNFGMTKEQITQSQPYDHVVRRLFELGWLTVES
ncbi:hypothetical protein [Bradyrhizobium arachidis]|uniref:Uncharacterized protein n=1 Tax=Bradyrhizobium arachidis TaxID=858423 RepID=A0AAE7NQ73_9BRAD|nr:hypothetical protein [Bradyrhizobium arachidis]QOZ69627.1 hypothetical protein WN72_27395 [Bradyrhizobium arachidis]SFU73634.1 hypothetical protein SAMN05192541_104150 [Bradyrhizobium arachidis]